MSNDTAAWEVHTGTYSHRYPYWVGRVRDGRHEHVPTAAGHTRKFASWDAAQKVADKMQVTADFDDAREHQRLAVHHLIRATNHLHPKDPLIAVLETMSQSYLDLTGRQL